MAKRKSKKRVQPKCYMCDKVSSSVEHVPPRSFFPNGRLGLVHVPSCTAHNEENAKDVEYIRNVIVTSYSTNEVARGLSDKAIRSLKRSPGLLKTTLRGGQRITFNGRETATFEVDLPRLKKVMRAIAYALYYKEYGQAYPHSWVILCPSLFSMDLEMKGLPDPETAEYRKILSYLPVVDKDTNHPDVFKYALYTGTEKHFGYKMTFYEGFIVYAMGVVPTVTSDMENSLIQEENAT